MQSKPFLVLFTGNNSQEAFEEAVEDAKFFYDHGGDHSGMLNKKTFTMLSQEPLTEEQAYSLASKLITTNNSFLTESINTDIAYCIEIKDYYDLYMFFGWSN